MTRRCFMFFCTVAVACLQMMVHVAACAQQASWQTKTITLACKGCSMTQGLEQLAAQANISILAEGEPAKKPFTLQASDNAGALLTRIADAYDYEWRMSKSGVVLLSKRFTDEHETPEINPAEMRASIQDVLTILRAVHTPPQPNISLADMFRQFAANLSEEQANGLKSEAGLPVSTLPAPLQKQATGIIYFNELQTVYSQMDYFARAMQALPTSSLTATQDIKFSNATVSKYVRLVFSPSDNVGAFILWNTKEKLETLSDGKTVEKSEEQRTSVGPAVPLAPRLQKAFTVAQMFALLQDRFHIAATIAPKMQDKHITLLLQDADAKRALSALGELENWVVQQKEGAGNNAFFLYRHSINIPDNMRDMRQSVFGALPPNVVRCFYTRPRTVGDKPYTDMHDLFPQLPGSADPRPFASAKMRQQQLASARNLRRSFGQETFALPIPYSHLTTEQKQDVLHILLGHMGSQVASSLWEFLYKPASYVTDPVNARMIATEHGFKVIGPGGGSFEAVEGPPVR